jgi:hypothetical protein
MVQQTGLSQDFRQYIHVFDPGGQAKIAVRFLLDTYHGRLATYPTFFPLGEFGRQDQHHFQFTAFGNVRTGVQKNPAAAQVTSLAGELKIALRRLDRDRHAGRHALPGTAIVLGDGHATGE